MFELVTYQFDIEVEVVCDFVLPALRLQLI